MSKVICVHNNKGGSLKTTTTTNLAGVIAATGKSVLVIDTDNQSNVALSFGINPDTLLYSIYDVLINELPAMDAIIKVESEQGYNISIMPSNDDLNDFDFEVIGKSWFYKEPFEIMNQKLRSLRNYYDYILIDTPPSLSLMVGNVFSFADEVLIPFSPENYSMRSLTKVIKTINDYAESSNPDLRIMGIVATMVNSRTLLHTDILKETRKYADTNGVTLFSTFIPHSIRFASSVAYDGVPASISLNADDRSKAEVYYELWKEVVKNG